MINTLRDDHSGSRDNPRSVHRLAHGALCVDAVSTTEVDFHDSRSPWQENVQGPRSLTAEPMTTTATRIKEYGGWLELSRSALHHNLAGVRGLVGRAQIMAVVKADAYGAGATGMASALQDGGVTRFAVATVMKRSRYAKPASMGKFCVSPTSTPAMHRRFNTTI